MKTPIRILLVSAGLGLVAVACKATRLGYESAAYTTGLKEAKFEIREYPALKVVSTVSGSKDGKRNDDGQFMRLFGYITGKNATQEKIAMTTPVFMDKAAKDSRMSFVLPADLKSSPAPTTEKVALNQLPARKMAVLRFSGPSGEAMEQQQLVKLRAWIEQQKLTVTGEPVVAYYDPPFTPAPLRRNEVMIPVK